MRQERLDKYDIIKEIGAGVSSKVKLGFHAETGESTALKILTNTTSEAHRNTFKNEVSMLRGLDHPNLINLKRYYDEVDLEIGTGSTKKVTAIALEFASNGDMCQYMETSGRFSENVARYYFRQIIEALEYCHQRGIMHRDVKPENLLFDESFNLKLADFGFAKFLNDRSGKLSLHTALGTDGYMAPEMHTGKPYDGRGVDLFAAGVVLFMMIVGHPPFGRADPRDSFYKFITKQREDLFWKYHIQCMDCKEDKESLISEDLKTLISPMLALDPNERFSIKEIKEHVWYDGPLPTREELLKEMLEKRSKLVSASDLAPQDSNDSVVPLPESIEEQKDASDAP